MNRARWEQRLRRIWYRKSRAYIALLPLSWLYCVLVAVRRRLYQSGLCASTRLNACVLVVGNLSVGGTGKTPLVIALSERLRQAGFSVGILTRGYLGRASQRPQRATPRSDPGLVGDEAVLLARRTGCVVFAGHHRVAAGRELLKTGPCDVLICDDGLQHYALRRDVEIATVDATLGQGNGRCLPAGPLREPLSRLRQVDAVVSVGEPAVGTHSMQVIATDACRLSDPADQRRLECFRGTKVHAVAGIANPQRFYAMLRAAGLDIQVHAFADHHPFRASDLDFAGDEPVLMTEKDAVKCEAFAKPNWWFVPVDVELDSAFCDWLLNVVHQRTKREGGVNCG
jgi:tetraacyldisaccharide 4'-kinase